MGVEQTTKSRRNRVSFTKPQQQAMETVFQQSQYPDVAVLEKLAAATTIPLSKICTWFQNRRAKFRRESKAGHIKQMRAELYSYAPSPQTSPASSDDLPHVLNNQGNANTFPVVPQALQPTQPCMGPAYQPPAQHWHCPAPTYPYQPPMTPHQPQPTACPTYYQPTQSYNYWYQQQMQFNQQQYQRHDVTPGYHGYMNNYYTTNPVLSSDGDSICKDESAFVGFTGSDLERTGDIGDILSSIDTSPLPDLKLEESL